MSSKSSKTEAPPVSPAIPSRREDLPERDDLPETVSVGRVLRPHGIRGEVVVAALSDVPGRFEKGSRLMASRGGGAPFPLVVSAGRVHKSGAVVLFEEFEGRDRAEELRGLDLEVPRSEVPPAPPGTYYQYELLGCLCRNDGEDLGRVIEVLEDGGGLMLIVEGEGLRVPVPFVKEFLREVDVARGRIDLSLPPGLLETCASRS